MSFFERRVQEAMGNPEYVAGRAEAEYELSQLAVGKGAESAQVPVYFWTAVEPVPLTTASREYDGPYLLAADEHCTA